MTDHIEIMAKAMWANDADERPWATDKDLEGIYDRYRLRANVAIAALNAAGLMIFTKQQAIDYVLNLPIEDLGDTQTYPIKRNTAGRRLRELQKAMIEEAGK